MDIRVEFREMFQRNIISRKDNIFTQKRFKMPQILRGPLPGRVLSLPALTRFKIPLQNYAEFE